MTEKQLLALMTALIYGQSKTLTAAECFNVALQIWEVVDDWMGEEDAPTPAIEPKWERGPHGEYIGRNPGFVGFHVYEAGNDGNPACLRCGAPADAPIHRQS